MIPSLNAITNPTSPPYDLSVPDVYRYQIWKQEFEKNGPANFNMMWLSSDHTGGPINPVAGVADGDLAVGKVVDEISHSKYWKDSAIFVVEDDSQAGADHVDGHRAPIQIISPWAAHGVVDHAYYSQINMVRTIEQILGAPAAEPEARRGDADVRRVHRHAGLHAVQRGAEPGAADPGDLHRAGLRPGYPRPDRRPGGADPEGRGAGVSDGQRRRLADLDRQAAHHRQGRDPGLREPGADEPVHVVPGPRMERPYPGDPEIYAPSKVPGAYIPSADTN